MKAVEKVEAHITDAVKNGAKVVTGETSPLFSAEIASTVFRSRHGRLDPFAKTRRATNSGPQHIPQSWQ